ncbi:MAG: serine/threonine-protein kinase, partial [Planctomycetota bacterium]
AALGLQYAERKGVVHRDIKPGNLMVGEGGIIKIGDLGIARSTEGEGQVSQKEGVSGSPHYIAPEQARGLDIDHRVDIYSLGISFYQMLCGQTPFRGATPREVILKQIKEEPPPLAERVENLPPEVASCVERMMAKDPEQRTPSATELLKEIEPLLERYHSERSQVPFRSRYRSRVVLQIFAVLLILTGVGIGIPLLYQRHKERVNAQEKVHAQFADKLHQLQVQITAQNKRGAETLLKELSRQTLPAELDPRLVQLKQDFQVMAERLYQEAREVQAKNEYRNILEALPDPIDAAGVASLYGFAEHFGDTSFGQPARERADELQDQLDVRQRHYLQAEHHLARLRASAEGYAASQQFKLARGELQKFEPQYQDTPAAQELQEYQDDLRQRALIEWERIGHQVEEYLGKQQFFEAKALLKDFGNKVDFAAIVHRVDEMRQTVIEAESQKSSSEPHEQPSLLAEVLARSLALWSSQLNGKKARGPLEHPRLFRLSKQDLKIIKDAQQFLHKWDVVFAQMVAQEPPRQRFMNLQQKDRKPIRVEVIRIDPEDGVFFNQTFYRWHELTPQCRAQVILRWARTPKEQLYAGFLAHLCGLESEAEEAWQALREHDPELAASIQKLKLIRELSASESH